jgi:hypothetical protein
MGFNDKFALQQSELPVFALGLGCCHFRRSATVPVMAIPLAFKAHPRRLTNRTKIF